MISYNVDLFTVIHTITELNKALEDFMNNINLLSQEYTIMKDSKIKTEQMSPEGMNSLIDGINTNEKLGKVHAAREALSAISIFKQNIVDGLYDTDLDLVEHPDYFFFLGKRWVLKDGSEFLDMDEHSVHTLLWYLSMVESCVENLQSRFGFNVIKAELPFRFYNSECNCCEESDCETEDTCTCFDEDCCKPHCEVEKDWLDPCVDCPFRDECD